MRFFASLVLAVLAVGCEKATTPDSPASPGSTRFLFTFSGVVARILETDSSQARAIVKLGDSVSYTFLVDTLLTGYTDWGSGRRPETDSADLPGHRPESFFDSLVSGSINPRKVEETAEMRYSGHRSEYASGSAGTFLTHEFRMLDSVVDVSVCFNDSVGGPILPSVGDLLTGTEHFFNNRTQKRSTLQSILEVIRIEPAPSHP